MLKATRGFAAIVALSFLGGCETTAESDNVPIRTAPPTVIAQAPAPAPFTAPASAPILLASATVADPATPPAQSAEALKEQEIKASEVTTNGPVEVKEVIPPSAPANVSLSEGVQKVIKLAQAHTDENILVAFVQKYPTRFDLDADEILYLNDVGVASPVVAAMLKHDGDDPTKADSIAAAPTNPEIAAQPGLPANLPGVPTVATQAPSAPPQQGVEVTTNYAPNTAIVQQQPIVVQQEPVVVQQPVVYAQPESVSYFYNSLSPYGSWMYVSDYGWCWQPSVAVIDTGWRPYGPQGRWVWTTSGWYWHSYYSWGWAPFHYGRWTLAGSRGWVWVPDNVWGPAWVSWRSTPDYCGWAPLPPAARFVPGVGFYFHGHSVDVSFGFGLGYDAFCFAPTRHFYHDRVWNYHVARPDARVIFANSHVENRFEVRRGEFINQGIPRDRVAQASGREIHVAEVRTAQPHEVSRFGARERVERSGHQEVVVRPTLATAAAAANTSSGIAHNRTAAPSVTAPPAQPSHGRAEATSRAPVVTTTPASQPYTPARPAGEARVVQQPQTRAPEVTRQPVVINNPSPSAPAPEARPAGQPRVIDPAIRRPIDSEVARAPESSAPVVRQQSIEPRVEVARPTVVQPTTPAPQINNEIARRSTIETRPPVTSSIQTPAPAPAYQAPRTYTPAPAPQEHRTFAVPTAPTPAPGRSAVGTQLPPSGGRNVSAPAQSQERRTQSSGDNNKRSGRGRD